MEYQQIADKLGVHRGTLFHWMSGHRSPGKTSMLKIAEELGWSVADQMDAFNQLTRQPDGTMKDSYGEELRNFLQTKHNAPGGYAWMRKATRDNGDRDRERAIAILAIKQAYPRAAAGKIDAAVSTAVERINTAMNDGTFDELKSQLEESLTS